MNVQLQINADPIAWAAPRFYQGVCHDPQHKIKSLFRRKIRECYKGDIYDGYVALFFHFQFKIPKSTPKKIQAQMLNNEVIPTRCDVTNCQKLFEDCLKGIIIRDDRKVAFTCSQKSYAMNPAILIEIKDFHTYNRELMSFITEKNPGYEEEIIEAAKSIKSDA